MKTSNLGFTLQFLCYGVFFQAQEVEVAGGLKMGAKSLCVPHEAGWDEQLNLLSLVEIIATPISTNFKNSWDGKRYTVKQKEAKCFQESGKEMAKLVTSIFFGAVSWIPTIVTWLSMLA